MPTARKHQICIENTSYYHCISRCVRRAFLCGEDKLIGKNYDHRKQWAIEKLQQLANVFSIEVCAYTFLDNHSHLVLKINPEAALGWSRQEVIERWTLIFSGGVLVQRYKIGQCKTTAEINKVNELVEIWRERLTDISWFMHSLNESIARQANAEECVRVDFGTVFCVLQKLHTSRPCE